MLLYMLYSKIPLQRIPNKKEIHYFKWQIVLGRTVIRFSTVAVVSNTKLLEFTRTARECSTLNHRQTTNVTNYISKL